MWAAWGDMGNIGDTLKELYDGDGVKHNFCYTGIVLFLRGFVKIAQENM